MRFCLPQPYRHQFVPHPAGTVCAHRYLSSNTHLVFAVVSTIAQAGLSSIPHTVRNMATQYQLDCLQLIKVAMSVAGSCWQLPFKVVLKA